MEQLLVTFNVTLTPEQKKELRKAYYDRSDITLVIKNKNLEGKDQLIFTADLAKRFNQIKKAGSELDITLVKERISQTLALIAYNELFAHNELFFNHSANSELPNISRFFTHSELPNNSGIFGSIFGSYGIFRSIFG